MSRHLRLLLAFALLTSIPSRARAACVNPSTLGDLLDANQRAEEGYASMNGDAFAASIQRIHDTLRCERDEIGPDQAASIHRMLGLAHFVEGKEELAALSFGSARAIDPSYRFPESLVPAGNRVLKLFVKLPVQSVKREAVPHPAKESFRFDGVESEERPINVPTVLQRFDRKGFVLSTHYLEPADPLPYYEQSARLPGPSQDSQTSNDVSPKEESKQGGPGAGLLTAAGVSEIIGGALWFRFTYHWGGTICGSNQACFTNKILPQQIAAGALMGTGAVAGGFGVWALQSGKPTVAIGFHW